MLFNIMHSNFRNNDRSLFIAFYWEALHLSEKGKELLLKNWADGLVYLNENPQELGYTPPV